MPRPKPTPRTSNRSLFVILALLAAVALGGLGWYLLSGTGPGPEPGETTTTLGDAPALRQHIYSETADPKVEISAALARAEREHKRVILDFGGDWCGDCQVLELYFHAPPNAQLLAQHYLVVHVWIGHMDANMDIPAQYGVPVQKGVPALAVLDPAAGVVYAQRSGEFEKMANVDPRSVTEFLDKWKS